MRYFNGFQVGLACLRFGNMQWERLYHIYDTELDLLSGMQSIFYCLSFCCSNLIVLGIWAVLLSRRVVGNFDF